MTARHVLSFPMKEGRFNFRVAGIVIAESHLLICREDDDDYCMLPGGRVELGEDSRVSLTREIAEELALSAEIGPLIATSESFYRREGEDFHELGFFYVVTLPEQGPNGTSPWLERQDEGHDLQFHWVPLDGDALETFNLLPRWLPDFLRDLPEELDHIIYDERDA